MEVQKVIDYLLLPWLGLKWNGMRNPNSQAPVVLMKRPGERAKGMVHDREGGCCCISGTMSMNRKGTKHIHHRTYNEICRIVPFSIWRNFRFHSMVYRFSRIPEAEFRERINDPGSLITLRHNLHKSSMDHLDWGIEFTRAVGG